MNDRNVIQFAPARAVRERVQFPRLAPERVPRPFVVLERKPSLYDTPEEEQRIARVYADVQRDLRVFRWQARIAWSCYALIVCTACYFAWEFVR